MKRICTDSDGEKNLDYKKHNELTEIIIGVFYDVYNELGFGFLESVYRKSFALALRAKGLRVKEEAPITVYFRSQNVGDFKADLVANELILVELKTADTLVTAHEAQVLNYLRATSLEVGLLFNFGPKPQLRRLLFDNDRKKAKRHRAGGAL